ncbi:uncharacterized protein C2orf50 homolog [Brachyistius frenatus]|uniref:uncharacterized protein C2orf50 homolog n=1 Tax=Brachyistius frenatus TaxID=100188 RepID=UPI0037E774A1
MDLNNVRRLSSAGYRSPERLNGSRTTTTTTQPADGTENTGGGTAHVVPNPDRTDAVKQDQAWKELVWRERRGALEWEKNWSFLRNYDQMGQLRSEEPQPTNVSLFPNRVPNTTNQMFGSRLSTPLGRELIRLDRMFVGRGSRHRRKKGPETLPCLTSTELSHITSGTSACF